MGILLTTPSNANTANSSSTITVSLNSGQSQTVDSHDGTSEHSIKWLIRMRDTVTNNTESIECHATHDYSSSVDYSLYNDVGTFLDLTITASYSAPDIIDLIIQNNEVNTIELKISKII